MSPAPVGCTLAGEARDERVAAWRAVLGPALLEREAIPAGARLRLRRPPALEAALAGLVAAEGRCCAHLGFGVAADGDALILDVTGPADAVASIRRVFALAPRDRAPGAAAPAFDSPGGLC
jgi:hypothetical protein